MSMHCDDKDFVSLYVVSSYNSSKIIKYATLRAICIVPLCYALVIISKRDPDYF